MRVLWRCDDSMMTSPPRPPSPPEGPPRGTNFSRRKAMQPFPPSPALTRILASSMNISRRHISNLDREQGANPHCDKIFIASLQSTERGRTSQTLDFLCLSFQSHSVFGVTLSFLVLPY